MNAFLKGFIPGILIPFLFGWLFIKVTYHGAGSCMDVLVSFTRNRQLTSLFSISALPNLLLFFFYLNRDKWMAARGVIAATLLYGIVAMVLHYVY